MIDILRKHAEDNASEQRDIEHLIASENDSKIRLQLMVMNRINLSLIANTEMINDIAQKLERHLSMYDANTVEQQALVNKGKGAWKVLAWVMGTVQVFGAAIWMDARADLEGIKLSVVELVQMDIKATARSEANAAMIRRLTEK